MGVIAAASYGMNPLFALPLYENGMNPDSVLFFRYLIAIPVLAIMLKVRGRDFMVENRHLPILVVFGFLMAMSSLALFQSYNYMDAGIASTLLFVYPILVALIMAVFFKEKLTFYTVFCVLFAVFGIGLLYKNNDGTTLSMVGTLLVFVSSLSYALYIVGVNKTSVKDTPTLQVTFYVIIFGLLLFAIRLLSGQTFIVPHKWYLWCNLFALAIFPTTISFICTTGAIQYIGSTPTAILGALEPVTALFFGMTVFNETLTGRDVVGIILILLAVTMVVSGGSLAINLVRLKKMFPKISKKK